MKLELTKDQSARLIELGIDASKASENTTPGAWADAGHGESIFILTDLIGLLPKWIKYRHYLCYLEMGVDRYSEVWYASYRSEMGNDEADTFQSAEELIDCLYELLVFLITENLWKP